MGRIGQLKYFDIMIPSKMSLAHLISLMKW